MPAVGDSGETLLAGATIAGWLLVRGLGASCSGWPSVGVVGGGGSLPVWAASVLIGAGGGASVGSAGGSRGGGSPALFVSVAGGAADGDDEDDEATELTKACAGGEACATATAARRPSARDGDEARMVGAGL
jgi:hypothetical protein